MAFCKSELWARVMNVLSSATASSFKTVTMPILALVRAEEVRVTIEGLYSIPQVVRLDAEENWRRLQANHKHIYDGELCRLAQAVRGADGHLVLRLQRTTYSAYVGTRSPNILMGHDDERANPLGLTTLVVSADKKLLITRRSLLADQNAGGLYFIGGYLEPPRSGVEINLACEAAREVLEEVHVKLETEDMWLLGIGYDDEHCHPEAFFLSETGLSMDEIIGSSAKARDADECSAICPVDYSEAVAMLRSRNTNTTWSYRQGLSFLNAAVRRNLVVLK